jgi:hypothetical protein
MRIWTVHPRYLDRQGLTALWREALLAQKVLLGKTKGYRSHPQLERFRVQQKPVAVISEYLREVYKEARHRGYCFDKSKIHSSRTKINRIYETEGQLLYEWRHLQNKLKDRSPELFRDIENIDKPLAHCLFEIIPGECRSWEKRKI